MNKPKFIVTRFRHGSAGKFLSTVLQTSHRIDHWSPIVQKEKDSGDFLDAVTLQYVSRSFPIDHSCHMQSEPMVPYCTDLYSVSYDRGQNVTLQEYLDHANKIKDIRLLRCMENDLIANLIFQRPNISDFCRNSMVVTILVSTDKEKNWLHQTLWSKHFLEINDKIHYLPNDKDYCNFNSLSTVLRFNNRYQFDTDQKDMLFEKYIVNNPVGFYYFDKANFTDFDRTNNLDNQFIKLSDFFTTKDFVNSVQELFEHFDLGAIDVPLVEKMHRIWWKRQLPA
jgi:hypothetical protein